LGGGEMEGVIRWAYICIQMFRYVFFFVMEAHFGFIGSDEKTKVVNLMVFAFDVLLSGRRTTVLLTQK